MLHQLIKTTKAVSNKKRAGLIVVERPRYIGQGSVYRRTALTRLQKNKERQRNKLSGEIKVLRRFLFCPILPNTKAQIKKIFITIFYLFKKQNKYLLIKKSIIYQRGLYAVI
ncbi:MAG: hypothetical protein LBQ37_02680 [Elusimicrobiota bacterium]|jgi:hypothetical protein|nr:hypothetical protein [Elusimicrobiota bacterium]